MSIILSEDEALRFGIRTHHEIMDNGERRFRLVCNDGTAYIRTVSTEQSGWQRSHFHKQVRETYIIEKGTCIFCEKVDGQLTQGRFEEGEIFTTRPNIPHNMYLYPGAVVHTVKHSAWASNGNDWHACPELDDEIRELKIDVSP